MGDVAGYVGLGADLIIAFNLIVYDEEECRAKEIKATKTENEDLFEALKGELFVTFQSIIVYRC